MIIKVVGCGGIGSYFAQHLDRLIDLKQIVNYKTTFYDDDKVELKNILYQNFESSDIDSFKTDALSLRYFNINFKTERLITPPSCDLLILCADNNKIRKLAYEGYKTNKIRFIDSRANGKTVGIFSSDTENYLDTLSDTDESSSCQNPFQLAKKEIEYGNVVIASILAQTVLNFYRTNKLPNDLILNI